MPVVFSRKDSKLRKTGYKNADNGKRIAGEYTVRAMQREDIPAVAAIEKSIFSAPWSEESFLRAFSSPDNIYLVSVSEEGVAGYCGIWISYETADLCNIAVAQEYRRQGMGEKLLSEAAARAESCGVERLMLEVRESNRSALCLYEKKGFQQIGIRKGYYDLPKEDAVLMQLLLSH